MFSRLLSSVRNLFAASPVRESARPCVSLQLESLEDRAVPSSFASQLGEAIGRDVEYAVIDARVANLNAQQGNLSAAAYDLNLAQSNLTGAERGVVLGYEYGFISLGQARHAYGVLEQFKGDVQGWQNQIAARESTISYGVQNVIDSIPLSSFNPHMVNINNAITGMFGGYGNGSFLDAELNTIASVAQNYPG